MRKSVVVWSLTLGALWLMAQSSRTITWVEETFEDFADGRLDASGQNLYISRDGKLRTIQRFDLNQDGYPDLIFNSTHDTATFQPATVATVVPGRRLTMAELPVEGSTRVWLEDLNRDGRIDAVFCPNDSGLQHPRRFIRIAYAGEDGFSARRLGGLLPVMGTKAVVAADLNHDQWPDVVALNQEAWQPGQPAGRIVRVYSGSAEGFLLSRFQDFGVPDAIDLAAADFDGDGRKEVAVLTGGGAIHWLGSKRADVALPAKGGRCLAAGDTDGDGRTDLVVGTDREDMYLIRGTHLETVPLFPASHITTGDLDGDGRPDLVLTDFSQSRAMGGEAAGAGRPQSPPVRVLWGSASGFRAKDSTPLSIPYATAAAAGDVDGDGRADLAVAVFQGPERFEAESVVYFGTGERQFQRGPGVRTWGAADVAFVPREGSKPARIIFANSLNGTVGEKVNTLVYWGGAQGFDVARRWEFPMRSGYEATGADLNADGFVDLLVLNSGHVGEAAKSDPTLGANIFWGAAPGFDLDRRRTVLAEGNLGSSSVADLDRDGYLDVVLGSFESAHPQDRLTIWYGSAGGFRRDRRVVLQEEGRAVSTALADFNRDGWLDIAVVCSTEDLVRIYWGSDKGFDRRHHLRLRVPFAISLETADLNKDGFLDLVVGSYQDQVAGLHDTGTTIFWGSRPGFQPWDAQWLPGFAPVGPAVADFDNDGYLDLFTPHYLGNGTRESLASYLYWGSEEGFHPRRRTVLSVDSAHDAFAADFDRDGRLDLAVVCHTRDGDHNHMSKVFYNDGNRFQNPRVVTLPTIGPHWMWDQDMGHIYDRRWRQSYESSVLRYDRPMTSGDMRYKAEEPPGARLQFEVRTGEGANWRTVERGRFPVDPAARALQYRVTLHSDNGDRYPVLDRVEITLEP